MSSFPTSSSSSDAAAEPLGALFDVECAVEVVLGTGRITMRDCLRLDRASIVRLDQAAGSDLELRVQGQPLADGEVVIVDDGTALRLRRIIPPAGTEGA
jgi:flagellar motor switch protein FliN/FliY